VVAGAGPVIASARPAGGALRAVVVLVAGLGNAAFHLGAGALVLRQDLESATPIGLFVAPGALGLAVGAWFGRTPSAGPTWLALVPVVIGACLVVGCTREPLADPARESTGMKPAATVGVLDGPVAPHVGRRPLTERRDGQLGERLGPQPPPEVALSVVGLLMVSIAVRALVGGAATRGYDAGLWLAVGVPAVAVTGKALGGVLADRFGWLRTTVTALGVSCPFLAFVAPHPAVLLVGLLVFQLTMPVTLVAVVRTMRGHVATGFGLTCLALVAGALPTMGPWGDAFVARPVLAVWVLVSAGVAWVGLAGSGLVWRRTPPVRSAWADATGTTSNPDAPAADAGVPSGVHPR
jgi:FSR family fosmidomycin resistance protein-like MFS transporter